MTEKRKRIGMLLLPFLLWLASMAVLSVCWLKEYSRVRYETLAGFSQALMGKDPEAELQIVAALKEYQNITETAAGQELLSRYGYEAGRLGEQLLPDFFIVLLPVLFVTAAGFLLTFRYLDRQNRRRIEELTEYLEWVNEQASGLLLPKKEDEFSRLQDEIYKTVTNLYQTREEAVRARDSFAENLANIAHQLKTPVTAALLSLQLMKRAEPSEHVLQTERQLIRLNRLEEALLTLSRIDAGTLGLERRPVDIYTALSLAADNLGELLRRRRVSVSIPEREGVEICGDLEWTMEALLNLMKNCMEHSPEGGTVFCDYSRNSLYTEIRIWDEGPGFEPEELPRLFERFYRGRHAAGNGIGIGLALARSVFELQNGTVTAGNLPEGGACFEIRVYCH